jgi:Tfp pilus assembly protein PilF
MPPVARVVAVAPNATGLGARAARLRQMRWYAGRVRTRSAVVLAAGVGLLGCASLPLLTRSWVEVRTPNFLILSPLPEADASELARELELFRSVVEVVTGKPIPASPVPLRVYAFDGPSSYRSFGSPGVAGYFTASAREGTVVMADWKRRDFGTQQLLQHEYVHFLLRNRSLQAYPPWYDEGLAEFLSTIQVRDGSVEIGRVPERRIQSLGQTGWFPLEEVLALRNFAGMSRSHISAFYAESWAFVHYLNLGRGESKPRAEMARYLKALRQGASNEEAVRQAFGESSATLGHKLGKYLKGRRYNFLTVGVDKFDTGAAPRSRTVGRAEVGRALGRLSNTIERFGQAQRYYQAALAEDPADVAALAGLAGALAGREHWSEAEARYRVALASAPDDALVHLDYANALHARAEDAEEEAERKRLALRAREHYVRSWKLDDSIPETYARYGATFLLDGKDAARGREALEHAHRMLPASVEIKLDLARLCAKVGRHDEARQLALLVSTWHHSKDQDRELQELLAKLEDR